MRRVSKKVVKENQNIHLYLLLFFFQNRAVYEKMSKNIVDGGRPQMTIWLSHVACWIPETTDTHSEYVIAIVFPLQQWLHEGKSLLCYA